MLEHEGSEDNNCDINQKLIPVDQAISQLLTHVNPVQKAEEISLIDALGRTLAEDLSSTINVPPADNSAMDGYAVRLADFKDNESQEKIKLPVSQRICAGEVGEELEPETAARIFTGAPIPKGADAVIMQEQCHRDGDFVTISASVGSIDKGTNIRDAGEDVCIDDTILKAGSKLKPQDLGLAASVGIHKVKVFRRLRVAVFFTGDELCDPATGSAGYTGIALEPGQIFNSNRYTLHGLLKALGCEIIDLGIIKDTLEATQNAMQSAAKQADLVMTSGGVSVGEEDYIRVALEELGQLEMWQINIKPGKPLAFGKIGDTPFLGMPGNPVSVFATFNLFARPYILKQQGGTETTPSSFKVISGFDWTKKGGRCEYVRVRVIQNEVGESVVELFPNQSSGVLTSVSWANGFAIIPPEMQINKGDTVEFIPFSELSV